MNRAQWEPWRVGGDQPSPWGGGGKWIQTMVDGTPAPPVISFVASKAHSRSVDATKAHDMTLAGSISLNTGIFLAAVVVDKALKGSMARERMNKSFGREVRGRG
jgi:hypothetical protein